MTQADDAAAAGTYQTPFGAERDRREALLGDLPGKLHHEQLESLNRASQVFGTNSQELERHLTRFVGAGVHVHDLPDDFDIEANRLLHNYLAGLATLRDVQRAIHHKLWPERFAPDSDTDQRTKWEVEVWDKKVKKLFADDGISFLTNLRNFSMHYSIPPLTLTTRLHSHTGGPVLMENVVALRRDELLKYTRWNGPARRFISAHDGDIEFLSVVATYSTRVREFYGWFWQQVEDEVRSSLDEFLGKSNEYGHWLKVEHTMPEFGPDGRPVRGSFRRKRAEARQERAAFGTRGWRLIQPNEDGEWVVGETSWPPLPSGPR